MGNPRRGEVDLELGGEIHTLVFDFNAISEIEAKFNDRPITEIFSSQSGAVPMRAVREALRIGMERRGRKRTSNDVGRMIGEEIQKDSTALARIISAIVDGLSGAFGRETPSEEGEKNEKPHPPPVQETGGA